MQVLLWHQYFHFRIQFRTIFASVRVLSFEMRSAFNARNKSNAKWYPVRRSVVRAVSIEHSI